MKVNKKILGLGLFMVGFLFYLSGNVFTQPPGPGGGNATNISFYGYTYNSSNNQPLNGTNVTVKIYTMAMGPPQLEREVSILSNGSGFFNLTLPGNSFYFYKPIIRHFNGPYVDYIGKSLPEFPYMDFSHLSSEIKFYLWEGATINLTVFGRARKFENVSVVWTKNLTNDTSQANGLEWNNNTHTWAYVALGNPNSLILLNHDFTFNKSYNVGIPSDFLSLADLEIVNNTWYYIINQSGHIRKYRDNETNLLVNQTFNLSRSYAYVASIEYDYCNDFFYISAVNISGNVTLDRYSYNGTNFVYNLTISSFETLGKLERPNCNSWFMITPGDPGPSDLLKLQNDFSFDPMGFWGTNFIARGIEYFPGYLNMNEGLYVLSNNNISRRIELYDDGTKNFSYMVKDTKLGYPIDELTGQDQSVSQKMIYLPANRNYSISIFPREAFPFNYELNNLSAYSSPKYVRLHLNASESLIWVSGYATLNDTANFDSLYVVGFVIEPGNMIFYNHPIPCNISSWRRNNQGDSLNLSDYFNATSGFYNITLIGSAQGSNVLLYAIARNGSNYYGAFKNISITADSSDITNFNFSLQRLIGNEVTNISCELFDDSFGTKYIETKAVKFRLQNASGSSAGSAHISAKVDYSNLNSTSFYWMTDLEQEDDGNLTLPLLNSSIEMEIFTSGFSPKSTTLTRDELSAEIVNITMEAFKPKGVGGEEFSDLEIDMLVNNDTCNVPYPSQSCSLMPKKNITDFNPLTIVMGGGELSFRMKKLSNGITVHYENVDMLASGPPDALFDSNANTTTENQTVIEQAWRFGSSGPEIYDSVLIGMPYSDSEVNDSSNISVLINNLYDEDWNVIWNAVDNTTDQLPSDYSDFNPEWFNTTTDGVLCNKTNESALCYVNTSDNLIWIRVPHFSGVEPNLKGNPPGQPPTQNITISLREGWNLISFPFNITT